MRGCNRGFAAGLQPFDVRRNTLLRIVIEEFNRVEDAFGQSGCQRAGRHISWLFNGFQVGGTNPADECVLIHCISLRWLCC